MSPKMPHFTFNADAFGHTFVGRRAGRWLQAQLDGLGKETVLYIVQNNRMLLDYLTPEMKVHYRKLAEQYRETFPGFTDAEVYNWIPGYWREVIESIDGGGEWGLRQVASVRKLAMG